MRPRALALSLTLVGWGCSANTSATLARMETEMRRMRSEQERQASQLEVLHHRVVITEDAAQQARRAVAATDMHRATIRLGVEATPAEPMSAIVVASVEVEIVRDPPRIDPDDDPTKRRTSLPSPDGVVEVKRRRIVRLG